MTQLWQTSAATLHPAIEHYTIGNDQALDNQLLGYDIAGTKAHAYMLSHIGILEKHEYDKIAETLCHLQQAWHENKFTISKDHEDGHTAIELYLTEKLGSIGKKVHTGRSRNDQALVMMRLYLKDHLEQTIDALVNTENAYRIAANKAGDQKMPGYTHSQKAMPSSVAMWLESYADALKDQIPYVQCVLRTIDQNPLGSAAGFGVALPLDRSITTKKLGFAGTQENPMYCGLSRGVFELMAIQSLMPTMTYIGKFADDMLRYTSQEFNFFSLPTSMTTGSSIMPHKQNYDVFEIMRGSSNKFPSFVIALQSISGSVGSGYHRDLQLTKEITLEALPTIINTLDVLALCVSNINIHTKQLNAAMTSELNTVNRIDALVEKGMPFRDAYLKIKKTMLVK